MRIESRKIVSVGKSRGITLSKEALERLGVQEGERIMVIVNDFLVLAPSDRIGEAVQWVQKPQQPEGKELPR